MESGSDRVFPILAPFRAPARKGWKQEHRLVTGLQRTEQRQRKGKPEITLSMIALIGPGCEASRTRAERYRSTECGSERTLLFFHLSRRKLIYFFYFYFFFFFFFCWGLRGLDMWMEDGGRHIQSLRSVLHPHSHLFWTFYGGFLSPFLR